MKRPLYQILSRFVYEYEEYVFHGNVKYAAKFKERIDRLNAGQCHFLMQALLTPHEEALV